MELQTLTLAGLVAYGAVGVLGYFKPDITDKRIKFALLFVIALICLFIPKELSNLIAERIKEAVGIALTLTTTTTIANKIGGN